MTKVSMIALDTMHVSSVQAENLHSGDEFAVSEGEAKQLEARGLAKRDIEEEQAPKTPAKKGK